MDVVAWTLGLSESKKQRCSHIWKWPQGSSSEPRGVGVRGSHRDPHTARCCTLGRTHCQGSAAGWRGITKSLEQLAGSLNSAALKSSRND